MIRVAIVEDHAGLAAGLRRIVEGIPDCQCSGVWRSGEDALAKVPAFRSEVVLMDINLPGMSGIEATAKQGAPCLPRDSGARLPSAKGRATSS